MRDNFDVIDNYWLNHSVGRFIRSGRDQFTQEYFEAWSQPEPWPTWFEILQKFRHSVADLLNTDPEQVCPQLNVSSALTKFLGALERKRPIHILLSEEDFPTISFVAKVMPEAQLHYIPAGLDLTLIETWKDYLTETIDVAILTHVYSNTGQRAPIAELTKECRSLGIKSVVDIAQSVGIVPIDISRWTADCVIGTGVKWLCSGNGAAFMWLDKNILPELKPTDVGWFSHANPFEFDPHHFDYATDAMRFLGGTPSVMPLSIAAYSINVLQNYGIAKISDHNRVVTERLIESLPSSWFTSPISHNQRGGTVVIKPRGMNIEVVDERLKKAGIHFDRRAHGFRFSPHIYTTMGDAERLLETLRVE